MPFFKINDQNETTFWSKINVMGSDTYYRLTRKRTQRKTALTLLGKIILKIGHVDLCPAVDIFSRPLLSPATKNSAPKTTLHVKC
jgi:hypothetical protein